MRRIEFSRRREEASCGVRDELLNRCSRVRIPAPAPAPAPSNYLVSRPPRTPFAAGANRRRQVSKSHLRPAGRGRRAHSVPNLTHLVERVLYRGGSVTK